MLLSYLHNWMSFTVIFGLLLLVTLIMIRQSRFFYTKDVIVRKFSIMELEVPATPKELVNILGGLFLLPSPQSEKSINALKSQLRLDFLFMPLAYGSIFLLSWKVAHKMQFSFGYYIFLAFAFLQLVPWICDIIENIYLLGKIIPDPAETNPKKHTNYLRMEAVKWGVSLTSAVCSISAIFYFWLTGNYGAGSFNYLLIVLFEITCFLLAAKISTKKNRIQPLTVNNG